MRLLRMDEEGTIRLSSHQSSATLRYAILSHTWGKEEDEVSYEDLLSGNGHGRRSYMDKLGYEKLNFCGRQAERDGYAHFWVDTCAIDKSSSAELSESVNSMFRWYQQASVCYALLSDVDRDRPDVEVHEQIPKSRWFRRGWTLQELVAPANVRFFDKQGRYLGNKETLRAAIRIATGINVGAVLWPATLETYSIATRMSWASHRETTRPEDIAYCLLGLLGVHMPLLYGEGDNAFRRLQEELIKISDDESIFAHSGCNLLAKSPEDFSGTDQVIVLRKSESAPYTITNAGLRIYMRVLRHASSDETGVDLAILNCHDYRDETTRDHYLALPLVRTTRHDTYRRQEEALRYVRASDVAELGYRDIFVQLRPPQVSRLTLLEQYDAARFTVKLISASCPIVRLAPSEGTGLRFYPLSPYIGEVVRHRITILSCNTFQISTYFDLENDRTGLEVESLEGLKREWLQDDYDTAFAVWARQGGRTHEEVPADWPSGSQNSSLERKVRVSVSDINDMKAFVWALRVEAIER